MRLRLLTLTAALCAVGCSSTTSHVTPIGGGWSIDLQLVQGSESAFQKGVLLRGSTVVDDWLEPKRYHFFAPDCVVYEVKDERHSWMAVCGDRTPIQLPSWILEVRDDGPWGGYVATIVNETTTERWSRLPLDRLIAEAQAQRRFFSVFGWKLPFPAPDFEREYVDIVLPAVVRLSLHDSLAGLYASEKLCDGAAMQDGSPRTNDSKRPVRELFGRIGAIELNEVGMFIQGNESAMKFVTTLLDYQPDALYRYNPWPDYYKGEDGLLATIKYSNGASGRFEYTNQHFCLSDDQGQFWWLEKK